MSSQYHVVEESYVQPSSGYSAPSSGYSALGSGGHARTTDSEVRRGHDDDDNNDDDDDDGVQARRTRFLYQWQENIARRGRGKRDTVAQDTAVDTFIQVAETQFMLPQYREL